MIKSTDILLIEDDLVDSWMLQEALKECDTTARLRQFTHGKEALDFLFLNAEAETPCLPDLIFLDLSLPELSGIDVLREIKANRRLRNIPVIILTHSTYESDVDLTYMHKASAHLSKPVRVGELAEILKFQYLFKPSSTHSADMAPN
jgi:CheY-like chemotaxis protein